MKVYVASSPFIDGADRPLLNPANDFIDRIREDLPETPRCLYIASSPDDHYKTCLYGSHIMIAFATENIPFSSYRVLDWCNAEEAAELIMESDLIVLAGGHVPTQNAFFREIGLDVLLQDYEGVVLGISAGSMNCASIVYAQPEEEGESIDPDFQRFLPGLGLTDVQILPHYQKVKDDIIDGQRLFEDVTYPDSMGHTFYALPDGSYFYVTEEGTLLCGESYRLRNSILERLTLDGESAELHDLF